MSPRLSLTTAASVLVLLAGTASSDTAAKSVAKPAGKTKGFVFTHFWYALSYGADDCPDGLVVPLPGGINPPKIYDAGRKDRRYSRPVGQGPSGEDDQCTHPLAFEDPPMRVGHGRRAHGVNLDGSEGDAPNTCRHQNFTGVDGTRGVDNQLYRVIGCINAYRPEQHFQGNVVRDFVVSARQDGQVTTLMEITGIDDERNDPEVAVGLYSSSNPTQYDADRKGVPYTSLTVNPEPRWQNKLRARIEDGVVITEAGDIRLDHYQGEGLPKHTDMYIRAARFKFTIRPDGTASGTMAGYSDVEAAYKMEFGMGPSILAKSWGWTCPSAYKAMHELADGYPDPKTGKCTAISTAYEIEAVPAFLIHKKPVPTEAASVEDAR